MGNGSEQQLQKELEDVLMDPSVAEQVLGGGVPSGGGMDQAGGVDHVLSPAMAAPPEPQPCPDPLSTPPKDEMVLPVQSAAQESELNERSYRGESEQEYQINFWTLHPRNFSRSERIG